MDETKINVSSEIDLNIPIQPSYDSLSPDTSSPDTSSPDTFSPDTTLKTTVESILETTVESTLETDYEQDDNKSDYNENIINITSPNKTNNDIVLNNIETKDCIICLEEGNLIENPFCNCKFFFHEQCYATWLINNNKDCIFCKKNIENICEVSVFNIDSEGFINNTLENTINNIIQDEPPRRNRTSNLYEYRTNRINNANIYVNSLNGEQINFPHINNEDIVYNNLNIPYRVRNRNCISAFAAVIFFTGLAFVITHGLI